MRNEKAYACCPDEIYPNMEMSFQFRMKEKFENDQGLVNSPVTFAEVRKKPQQLTATLSKSTILFENFAIIFSCAILILKL